MICGRSGNRFARENPGAAERFFTATKRYFHSGADSKSHLHELNCLVPDTCLIFYFWKERLRESCKISRRERSILWLRFGRMKEKSGVTIMRCSRTTVGSFADHLAHTLTVTSPMCRVDNMGWSGWEKFGNLTTYDEGARAEVPVEVGSFTQPSWLASLRYGDASRNSERFSIAP